MDHSFGSAVSSRHEHSVVYTIIDDVVTREGSQTLTQPLTLANGDYKQMQQESSNGTITA